VKANSLDASITFKRSLSELKGISSHRAKFARLDLKPKSLALRKNFQLHWFSFQLTQRTLECNRRIERIAFTVRKSEKRNPLIGLPRFIHDLHAGFALARIHIEADCSAFECLPSASSRGLRRWSRARRNDRASSALNQFAVR